jgi:hypothetical protein
MFETLNNSNPASRQSVDDIFAETDQSGDAGKHINSSEITTRRVGLAASTSPVSVPDYEIDHDEKSVGGGKGFKIAVVGMVVVIVGLLGFLAYSKFFKADTNEQVVATNLKTDNTNKTPAATTVEVPTTPITTEEPAFTTTTPVASETSTTTSAAENNGATSSEAVILATDSDSDGLTDDEELIAKTNINLIDTDNDGLSDYEEIKIYQTNPLMIDSDGDKFSDGEEVRNGYNPNGAGKLPGNIVK